MTAVGEVHSLTERVRSRLASEPLDASAGVAAAARLESQLLTDTATLAELTSDLSADLTGAGPLEQLLALPGVTDVLVHGFDNVWIDRGTGLQRTGVRFADDSAVRRLASRLAAQAGRRLDDSMPYVDACLPDGTRLHAILPPLVRAPALSLRVLARRRLSLADLLGSGALDATSSALARAIVGARLNLLISGGTGSGKTTMLAALLSAADPGERIITVEDAGELAIHHPHVVALVARQANTEGGGGVGMAELVRQALRMRPDRLVVGEFRGAEIADLLAALNTGHDGGAATVHANSAEDVPARLLALGALAGMGADVLSAQAASAFDVLMHLRRDRAGFRFVYEIAVWPRSLSQAPATVWCRETGIGAGAAVLAERLRQRGTEVPEGLIASSSSVPLSPLSSAPLFEAPLFPAPSFQAPTVLAPVAQGGRW